MRALAFSSTDLEGRDLRHQPRQLGHQHQQDRTTITDKVCNFWIHP